jgi:hypothetical protein
MKKYKLMFIVLSYAIIVTAVLYSKHVFARVSFQQIKNVFSYLENSSGYHVPLCYDESQKVNASSDANEICITQGMLNELKTNDQIAMVLGHELTHYIKQHFRQQGSAKQELEADAGGYYYCKKLGYKKCLTFLMQMRRKYGEEGKDGIHPSWTRRLEKLKHHAK